MKINNILNSLEKYNYKISIWAERIAIVAVVGMIATTMVDVIGAKLFHKPLAAGTEAIYLLQVIAIAGALAMAKIDGRHVRIELIDRLRQPHLGIIHTIVAFFSLILFLALAWTSYDYAQSLRINNEITATTKIPLFPFAIFLGLCCIPLILIIIRELISSILEMKKR